MENLNKDKMKRLGVLALYLFGSIADGAISNKSDIDIGVVLKNPEILEDTRALYNVIYEELSRVFNPTFFRRLDIVFLQNAPIPLQYNAIAFGQVLYEEDPIKRTNYEERVINQYIDFKPLLEYFDSIASKRYT